MTGVQVVARYTLREAVRRRVFVVVLVLTASFLGLYGLGVEAAFDAVGDFSEPGEIAEEKVIVGGTLFGLAMFVVLFLGVVLAVFLTLGAIRGDAERGLLQPLVVRPVGRTELLLGRFAAAGGVCVAYALGVYVAAMVITGVTGGWWPDRPLVPALGLVGAVLVVVALSLLGSTVLSSTANGIAMFMVFGAGLAAGLLGQIGRGLDVDSLETVGEVATWLLPFQALYQSGLYGLTADSGAITDFIVQLGPFGGARDGGLLLWLWALVYLAGIGAAARALFARRDV